MAGKKIIETPESGVKSDLQIVKELINTIKEQTEWTKEDEVKLIKLDKILALITKVVELEKKVGKKPAKKKPAQDAEIIKRFLLRKSKKK